MDVRFADRTVAGIELGRLVAEIATLGEDALVLGLPRGGVPVAAGVANALGATLDVFVVRKLGVPGHPEVAMGAIASGGVEVRNEGIIDQLGISPEAIAAVVEREVVELTRREALYRGDREPAVIEGRDVVIVDDGLATGASMRAAIAAVAASRPRSITVAVPVAPRSAVAEFEPIVDRFVAVSTPSLFGAVGYWYDDFHQTTDAEVRIALAA